jgi:hypothetical protein
MIATRVTESYASLFRPPKRDDGPRHAAVARIGTFEVLLVEMPSVNASEEMSLWVELYDRDLQFSVDSRKCSDLDEAVDATHFLIAQARLLNKRGRESADSRRR